ncbi:NIPSNAP family protein [Sphingomonas sp. BT-65]|uniref:NIPSNAP family protein n=1 Tax=Sphingomonas sp. BT-65 TaxID=2989821 RepID=UPI0022368D36|nr:NIPSNAP family protein [Sphingomonas sp. BT-65]MCW4463746.1 NIPSNAP family protein [Sphingomonas sp. BT-65]
MPREIIVLAALAVAAPAPAQNHVVPAPVYQLRIYELYPQTKAAFHDRFRDHAMRIMKRHGFKIVSMWETGTADKPQFAYLLRWPSEDRMKAAWAAFMADEEWARIKRETPAAHRPIVGEIQDRTMRLTDYSPPM